MIEYLQQLPYWLRVAIVLVLHAVMWTAAVWYVIHTYQRISRHD